MNLAIIITNVCFNGLRKTTKTPCQVSFRMRAITVSSYQLLSAIARNILETSSAVSYFSLDSCQKVGMKFQENQMTINAYINMNEKVSRENQNFWFINSDRVCMTTNLVYLKIPKMLWNSSRSRVFACGQTKQWRIPFASFCCWYKVISHVGLSHTCVSEGF
jgi:hypothetical protein